MNPRFYKTLIYRFRHKETQLKPPIIISNLPKYIF